MQAPDQFVALLHRTFDGRLRIRWSAAFSEFHIEQKVGRAVCAPIRIEEGRDDLIRARDGFDFVMAIRTGDRMPCPVCSSTLRVPVMDTMDVRCGYCHMKGRTVSVACGYWPLNDRLIAHLQKIDPLRVHQAEQARAADRHNQQLLKAQEDAAIAPSIALAADNFNLLAGIPSVGYTGKEFRGAAA